MYRILILWISICAIAVLISWVGYLHTLTLKEEAEHRVSVLDDQLLYQSITRTINESSCSMMMESTAGLKKCQEEQNNGN